MELSTPQPGIFALGTNAQYYLELDRAPGTSDEALVRALAALEEPGASLGGVNLVVGFRPELWASVAGPLADAASFDAPLTGPDGFTMPATQHDAWLWVSGASQDVVFDVATALLDELDGVATAAHEVVGWPYQRVRDLTGFVDGTENPPLAEAPAVALVPPGEPGGGGTVVLVQSWRHLGAAWRGLSQEEQEAVIGRSKPDSVELDASVMPPDSHVARTVVEQDGEELAIFRRNTPYGTVTDHGTHFVGFSSTRALLQLMVERMAGVGDGVRDALTRYTEPLTGAYYSVPSQQALNAFRPAPRPA